LIIRSWDEYLGPRRMKMGSEEGSTIRNLIFFYRSSNIVRWIEGRRLRWTCHLVRIEEGRSAFKSLTCSGRPRRRWEDNIRIDLEEIDINAEN